MRRATVTIPEHLEETLEGFRSSLPARPSLASVVEAALEAYFAAPPVPTSRLVTVIRSRERIRELCAARGIVGVGVFGSVAAASDGPDSDVDL